MSVLDEPRATHAGLASIPPLAPLPSSWRSLPRALLVEARRNWDHESTADSTGARLKYGELALRALALARVLGRTLGPEPHVGVLLPPTVAAATANIALAMLGKISVNLNYSTGAEVLDSSVEQAGIKHYLTSRLALKKLGLEAKAEPVFLEDIPRKVTKTDKAIAGAVGKVLPLAMAGMFFPGLRGESLDAPATVIFTSGSTGEPKGVVLTHGNVLANVRQVGQHLRFRTDDVLLGVLPFFHSFGYTVTLWMAHLLDLKVVYHINPLDARVVGNLCQEHRVTMVTASPTFMRGYAKKCDREQFVQVRLPILGAEKLKPELAEEMRQRLGIEPLEGYGCTETGPVAAVNSPEPVTLPDGRVVAGNRPGTVGRLVPGTQARTIDPETGADLPDGAEGIVLIKGPQIMKGYLHREELTSKVVRDGWYVTGDLGFLDADGFLSITGRLSRFSKIAGEMVPHERVESAIIQAAEHDHPHVAVTSLPDARRGERLIVLYTDLGLPPKELHRKLLAQNVLPRLWTPSPDDFLHVDAIPILATGKVDLRQLRTIAEQRAGVDAGGTDIA
jgi:acyl-[acyl-carrier-protein]-phospholipid O-acyltransferase/long-chain-fatty-acid--[acyl-carrier-protein] ligase